MFVLSCRSQDSNPGAATPYSLYKLYSKQAAATANPFTLRQVGAGLSFNQVVSGNRGPPGESSQPLLGGGPPQLLSLGRAQTPLPIRPATTGGSARRLSDSPPRASFKVLAAGQQSACAPGLTLSLSSLR